MAKMYAINQIYLSLLPGRQSYVSLFLGMRPSSYGYRFLIREVSLRPDCWEH